MQRLYYMTSLETLEEFILPDMRIRLSTFDAVNDPFELLAIRHGGREQRRRFAWLYWVQLLGFVSVSESWRSPLMGLTMGATTPGCALESTSRGGEP